MDCPGQSMILGQSVNYIVLTNAITCMSPTRQIVSPLKMKEQLVSQLKTQITDLERFINYLQGEVSTETLACTCACPVHAGGGGGSSTGSSGASSYGKRYFNGKPVEGDDRARSLNTVRKVVALLHMFLMSQLGCGSEHVRRNFKKNPVHNWRDLRTRLDIAVEHVLETIVETQRRSEDEEEEEEDDDVVDNENDYASDSDSSSHANAKLTSAVRKHLAISIRDLMQHGLSSDVLRTTSVVPFVGCFPQRSVSSSNFMHAWELILKYYEIKNGRRYNSSPAQKLSQSFNLDLAAGRIASSKQVQKMICKLIVIIRLD